MPDIQINRTYTVTDEFLLDLFITALEGGIGYWSVCNTYYYADPTAFFAEITEQDEDMEPKHTINAATICLGITRILNGEIESMENDRFVAALALGVADSDASQLDADDCDMIVQAGLFGEIRYG